MKEEKEKHIDSIAWHVCLLLSDNNMDKARKKFKVMKE